MVDWSSQITGNVLATIEAVYYFNLSFREIEAAISDRQAPQYPPHYTHSTAVTLTSSEGL